MPVHILFVIDQCDLNKRWHWRVDQYKVEMAKGAPGGAKKNKSFARFFRIKKND